MNTSTYLTFSSIDYKGEDSLSSYALSVTPFRFVTDFGNILNSKLVWDFGDGTISREASPIKYYSYPGTYIVNLVQYDSFNNATISNYTRTIEIYDYIPLKFDVTAYNNTVEISAIQLENGKIEGPLKVEAYFPFYQTQLDIFYDIKNSNSDNYWDVVDNKFSHLQSTNSLYKRTYNYAISSYEFSEIDKITLNLDKIFIEVNNGVLTPSSGNSESSQFVGMSGATNVYIKVDDIPTNLLVDMFFDKTNYINPYIINRKIYNNLGITLSASVSSNTPNKLSITSNGIDGEGYPIDSFKISPIKFYNTKIPFVVKIKDVDNFSIKNFNTIQLSSLNIVIYTVNDVELVTENGEYLLDEEGNQIYANGFYEVVPVSSYEIGSLNYTLSSYNIGGSFRGYINFFDSDIPITNVKISVSGNFTNDLSATYSLSGVSNAFNVYPDQYYDLFKNNENFDTEATLKDLIFQEILLDKSVLFEDFLGGILGNYDYDHEDIGLKNYERIANFVQNTADIDYCGVDFIKSMADFLGYNNNFEEYYRYPEKIKRLLDILSIDKNKLLGYENKFNLNFDPKGRVSKDEYGVNLGNIIDTRTYIVSSNSPIVALEKFSNDYVLLNTVQPVSATGTHIYPLSNYSSDWGWPLVLPTQLNWPDIEKYYLFFEFNNVYDNTITDGTVDFENYKTTIPYSLTQDNLNIEGGIKDYLFTNTLYKTLSIIN